MVLPSLLPNTPGGYAKTWRATKYSILVLLLLMLLLVSAQITLASPSDKWDENVQPIIVTDYLKDENAGNYFLRSTNEF